MLLQGGARQLQRWGRDCWSRIPGDNKRMAGVLEHFDVDTRRAEQDADVEPPLFRFGLRRLMLVVTAAVLLLGAMTYIGGGWAVGLGFLVSLVVAHVLATFVGTRLRDRSPSIQKWRAGIWGDDVQG